MTYGDFLLPIKSRFIFNAVSHTIYFLRLSVNWLVRHEQYKTAWLQLAHYYLEHGYYSTFRIRHESVSYFLLKFVVGICCSRFYGILSCSKDRLSNLYLCLYSNYFNFMKQNLTNDKPAIVALKAGNQNSTKDGKFCII